MKKYLKIFILLIICFLPVMVDAKINFEFNSEYINQWFFYRDNDEYYFVDPTRSYDSTGFILTYDKNNELINGDKYSDDESYTDSTIINSKYFEPFYKMFLEPDGEVYDKDNNKLYYVDYYYEIFSYYDYEQAKHIKIDFNEDLNHTKKLLGKKYDVYLTVKNTGVEVNHITESNGYYIVYYNDEEYKNYISVLDGNYKIILTFSDSVLGRAVYVYDDLIYLMETDDKVAVYKLDGTQIEILSISNNYIAENSDNYFEDSCDNYIPESIYIENNEFYIMYSFNFCGARIVNFESGHDDSATGQGQTIEHITLKYDLNYDVETVNSSNGEVTYKTKVDEDGRSYVELKVVPKYGYSVEEIIVTDSNGKEIEVTNNKFYRPVSDVKVEVKYVKGEYLPIPDTFLGINPMIIILSILLIIYGVYLVYVNIYCERESKE